MKKLSSILLAVAMVAALAGCGSGSVSERRDISGSSSASSSGAGSAAGEASGPITAEDGYAEGFIGDTLRNSFFEYTVNSAYVCDSFETYTPAEGNELLVVDVTVKNISRSSIEMYDTDFQAQWNSDGDDDFSVPITYDGSGTDQPTLRDDQLPGTYTLGVSESREGLLVFEVPAGLTDFSLSYMEVFSDDSTGDTFFVFFSAGKQDPAAQA